MFFGILFRMHLVRYVFISLVLFSMISCDNEEKVANGYTDRISYFPGDTCRIFVNPYSEEKMKAKLRLTNIEGKTVDRIAAKLFPQDTSELNPWENGFGYELNAEYVIPDVPSGFYFIDNKIPIVVKSRDKKPLTLVYPSNTLNAYNTAGGHSLYVFNSVNNIASNIVSFHRPMPFGDQYASPEFFSWIHDEYGENINYICDSDLDDYETFGNSDILLIPGHNEYWSRKARLNVDKYVDAGGHGIVLSGNVMWWQVRYDPVDGSILCYKDWNEDPIADTLLKTVNWNDPKLNYPIIGSIGANFVNGGFGYGIVDDDNGYDGYKIVSPESPLLEGTDLKFGDVISLPTSEFDGAPLLGFDKDSVPILDLDKLPFQNINLIGFDIGFREGPTVGTFIVFQKRKDSGIVINAGSTNWCEKYYWPSIEKKPWRARLRIRSRLKQVGNREWDPAFDFDNQIDGPETIKTITVNMIEKLLSDERVFVEN